MENLRHIFKPAKMLICFMNRRRGDRLMEISKAAGARGGTIAPGRTMADNRLLQVFSLADVNQDVVFTILGQEMEAVVSAIIKAAGREPKKLGGLAILLDVSGMLFRVPGQERLETTESENLMKSGFKLITAIVNHGYADDVMAAARQAGAKGGTILTARGTGTEEDVKFFGISLVPEKEMLMIVAETEALPAILEAIGSVPDIRQPGGGIVYHLDIERFIPLGWKSAE
jgi:nitrogen regulatory protein PII